MQVPCLCGTRKSRPRVKSELRKQQYAVTPFDCNLLAHVIVLWPMQNLCVIVQFSLCFISNLRAISKYKPLGAYIWRGYLTEGFLHYVFGGAYMWRCLFSEFCGSPATIFIFTALLFMVESKCFSRLIFSNFQAFCFSDLIYTLRY